MVDGHVSATLDTWLPMSSIRHACSCEVSSELYAVGVHSQSLGTHTRGFVAARRQGLSPRYKQMSLIWKLSVDTFMQSLHLLQLLQGAGQYHNNAQNC